MKIKQILFVMFLLSSFSIFASAQRMIEVSSISELAKAAAESGTQIKMKPGVYKMSDYFTEEKAAEFKRNFKPEPSRQPVWMLEFGGSVCFTQFAATAKHLPKVSSARGYWAKMILMSRLKA